MTDTAELNGVSHELETELAAAKRKIVQMEADFNLLNQLMNTEATERSYCSEYDEMLESWNNRLTVLKLGTRRRTYTVDVEIKLTYANTVEVEANSESHARDLVNDMTTYDVIGGLGISDYDDYHWNAGSVREGSL